MIIVKIRDRDGQVRFVRVNASNTTMARQIAQQQIGGGEQIEWAMPPDHQNAQADPDFSRIPQSQWNSLPQLQQTATAQPGPSNAPQPAPTGNPPAPTGSGPNDVDPANTAAGGGGVDSQVAREGALPDAAFRAFLQSQGAPTSGVGGNILQSLLTPAFQTLQGLNQFQAGQGQASPDTFDSFLRRLSSGGQDLTRSIGGVALESLHGLGRFEPGGNGQFANATLQGALRPTSFDTDAAQGVVGTGLAALRGRNPFLAGQFGGQLAAELERRFRDMAFAGDQPSNFARFIQTDLGL